MVSSSLENFPVENILESTDGSDWLVDPQFIGDNQGFVMRVSHCPIKVSGISLRNPHHGPTRNHNSFATRRFRLWGSLQEGAGWTPLLEQELEETRTELEPPMQKFFFPTAEVSYLAFELLDHWGQAGGLEYFSPITDCHGPLQPTFVFNNSFDLVRYPPKNLLSFENNIWLARPRAKGHVFTLKLSTCVKEISALRVQNANHKLWATRRFRVFWALENDGPWRMLLDTVLADSRFKKEVSLEIFPLKKATRLRFLRFQLLSFWGKGGGLQHFSAVPAEGCKNTQGPSIVRSVNPSKFPASNLLTLESVLDRQNFWLAKKGRTQGQGFTMAIGDCKSHVPGVALKNIQNRNWATKRFRISGALQPRGPWQPLMEQYVEDSRTQGSAPLQQFFFQEPTELHFLKFDLLDFWGLGGGLQYFSPLIDCKGALHPTVVQGQSHPKFSPENVLKDGEEGSRNYWLAKPGRVDKQGFILRLSICQRSIFGIRLRNTHNGHLRDRGTKMFRVSGALQETGPYEVLLESELEDSRLQDSPPLQTFPFEKTVVRFLKFELLDFWGVGGGLRHFGALTGRSIFFPFVCLQR